MLESLIYFVKFLMAPIILSLGLVGNQIGFIVLTRKNIRRIGPRNMYRYLFVSDTLYLLLIIVNYLGNGFVIDLTTSSKYVCKLYWYLNFILGPISPVLLCYISIEKLVSIKSPSRKFFLRRNDVQGFFLAVTIAFNALFYLPVPYAFHIQTLNETFSCGFEPILFKIIVNIDLVNRVVVPFFIMLINSFLLLVSIHRMKQRISENFKRNSNQNYLTNIKLLFSLFILNITYIVSALPVSIVFPDFTDISFIGTLYLNYASYSLNFYIIVLTNSLFRKEFFLIFK